MLFGIAIASRAADVPQAGRYRPSIADASDEGRQAIARFKLPAGSKMRQLAAEPMLANPVAFSFDEKGRAYVVETFRHHKGVTDIRGHMDWLEDDLASRTVADRVAMYKKHLKEEFPTYNVEQERIKLLVDTDGDGIYDKDTVFADGFREPEDGLGAGVLARGGDVFFTCLPKLWLLKDTDGDGKSDVRKALHDGFGIHVGFLGHDLHGLKIGPDGLLYFSIGDRGINVISKEGRRLNLPDTGSVLRCDLDGSNLEVFAWGLRNPQELVFDEFGNLFTHDNNSDSGDKARVTYLVEGGDHGWRIGYQFFEDRGAWNNEKLWYPPFEGQAAYIFPPIDNLGNGPSGITYNPGLGLGGRYANTFFVADFKGSNALSGVRAFTLEPKGAGFRMKSTEDFVWGMCVTDLDFAPDGGLVMSDWVDGWAQPGKGRLYELTLPEMAGRADLVETKQLIAEDLSKRTVEDLLKLLDHADMRVRQEAQFALVSKGSDGKSALKSAAAGSSVQTRLGRLHGIWGIGMLARKDRNLITGVRGLLNDADPEIRAQAAKLLGEIPDEAPATFDRLAELLKDDSHRVRFFAAKALGRTGASKAAPLIRDAVAAAEDKDPWLRHSYVLALSRINDRATFAAMLEDDRTAVRKAAAVALRRNGEKSVAKLLNDKDLSIALEAARAIHDEPVLEAMPALASLGLDQANRDQALLRRVIAANVRLGDSTNARKLVEIGNSPSVPAPLRAEAIRGLANWATGRPRDPIVGVWRPIESHEPLHAANAFMPYAARLVEEKDPEVALAAIEAAGALKSKPAGDSLMAIVSNPKADGRIRVEAILALESMDAAELAEIVDASLNDKDDRLRAEARRILARINPSQAIELADQVLASGSIREKQAIIDTVARLDSAGAVPLLEAWMNRLIAGEFPAQVHLDVLLAARAKAELAPDSQLPALIKRYDERKPAGNALEQFIECLEGGDAAAGRRIVLNSTAAACLRCHIVQKNGGNVGPDLDGIGKKYDRRTLLESIVTPDARIADGFKSIVLALKDGTVVAGVLKSENDKEVVVVTADAVPIAVPVTEIEERAAGISAMPSDLSAKLSPREIRDVVEFLSTLK
jgi:quinoprotein glucose dehydrogenase